MQKEKFKDLITQHLKYHRNTGHITWKSDNSPATYLSEEGTRFLVDVFPRVPVPDDFSESNWERPFRSEYIAWILHYGESPRPFAVSHKSGNKLDNRYKNLFKCNTIESYIKLDGIPIECSTSKHIVSLDINGQSIIEDERLDLCRLTKVIKRYYLTNMLE